jgi:helix-turn-helix protein
VRVRPPQSDELDIKAAAAVAGRTTETIRRWVWSGRLPARRRGNRLLVTRRDVEALAGGRKALSLADWLTLAERGMSARPGAGTSAADLVLEERRRRLEEVGSHRGR